MLTDQGLRVAVLAVDRGKGVFNRFDSVGLLSHAFGMVIGRHAHCGRSTSAVRLST
ncbi:hypothetical protein GALL_472800 [mine drainage metagenome]|uniref:Uncharacterized protein n=1 Tax=mine drainage metagenome TaxID=410659 RepID=A0A1J5PJX3_9ZZZZ